MHDLMAALIGTTAKSNPSTNRRTLPIDYLCFGPLWWRRIFDGIKIILINIGMISKDHRYSHVDMGRFTKPIIRKCYGGPITVRKVKGWVDTLDQDSTRI